MPSESNTGLQVQLLPSPETLSLPEAKKLAGLTGDFPTEILGIIPNAGIGQSAEGLTRLTALNAAQKWSNDAYHWCVGMVGFSPSEKQNKSLITHTATHGDATNEEFFLLEHYHEVLLDMLEAAKHPLGCEVALFGGVCGHYSSEFRTRLAEMIARESGRGPLIISPLPEDTMRTPKPKRVLVDTQGGRIFYFEPSPKKTMRGRTYRFGEAGR